jgi:hypothetical protein
LTSTAAGSADVGGGPSDLAVSSELTLLGNTLFVAQVGDGDVEACNLAPNKVSHCHTVATLTGANIGNQGGSTAIFTQP